MNGWANAVETARWGDDRKWLQASGGAVEATLALPLAVTTHVTN
jgi:hypothetical protein